MENYWQRRKYGLYISARKDINALTLIVISLIWPLMSYFIMISITDMFISMTTLLQLQIKAFWNKVILVLQSLISRDVSASGPLFEYCIEHVIIALLYVLFIFSTRIFCRSILGFATDCLCGVWYRGLTTCLLHVGPLFWGKKEMTVRFKFDIMKYTLFHCF